MFKMFQFRIRLIAACLPALIIAIGAYAQFRIPQLPNVPPPRLPNFGRGNQPAPSPQELLQSWKNITEAWDLDNPEQQRDLGQSIAIAISNRYPVSKDRKLNEYVNLVGLTVASVSSKPEMTFTFGVLETSDVGAYSTPGGYVFITRGALALANDESELAGVLAHEVAHVVFNHGIEAVKSGKFRKAADPFVKQYGQNAGAFAQFVDEGADFIMVKGYSQEQERQADAKAIEYLILANYDPRGFARFLNRLDQQNQSRPQNPLMSTHPLTRERVGAVTRQIASYRNIGGVTLQDRFAANVPRSGTPAPPAPPAQHQPEQRPSPAPDQQIPFVPRGLFH